MKKGLLLGFLVLPLLVSANEISAPESPTQIVHSQKNNQYTEISSEILSNYQNHYLSLDTYSQGHFSLRLYRQTLDPIYKNGIAVDLYRIANKLNYFANDINTPEKIFLYSQKHLANYKQKQSIRSHIRYETTKNRPEYFYLGLNLISAMARANEYGLKSAQDSKLRAILDSYDFSKYVTDKKMIRAWAAQLANQVYWLKQLNQADYIKEFTNAFKAAYPDRDDKNLNRQQYENKLYGLTHIILADSMYYQTLVSERKHQWIYTYFRNNINTILLRAKPDILAEVGVCFMLANKPNDPVVAQLKQALVKKYDSNAKMIPSVNGSNDLENGEHRNTLAIMFLNWQGPHMAPTADKQSDMVDSLPYGLIAKN
ncbi:DUF3541 domain-containing protein [Vibrio salinus]|uniref:DUF3541 domain-containing protein n=1 Tax=Vibrio salinus TaxID=2899784 RepID=UPI001E5943F3|nr:DUF3541 domain-containing protein [Vibrio salinus]MCE0494935.1 DUF3541 domain-containing protein [Vibrio salinus]